MSHLEPDSDETEMQISPSVSPKKPSLGDRVVALDKKVKESIQDLVSFSSKICSQKEKTNKRTFLRSKSSPPQMKKQKWQNPPVLGQFPTTTANKK